MLPSFMVAAEPRYLCSPAVAPGQVTPNEAAQSPALVVLPGCHCRFRAPPDGLEIIKKFDLFGCWRTYSFDVSMCLNSIFIGVTSPP
jgi:hypothetical protein